jgi:asparagine synthase (glutamine-hydrolysing)
MKAFLNVDTVMVYIAALKNKDGKDVSKFILKMLRNIGGSWDFNLGIASSSQIEYLENLDYSSHISPVLVGAKNINNIYPPYPLLQRHAFAFDGFIYESKEPENIFVANQLQDNPKKGIINLIQENLGAFSIVAIEENHIICGRDIVGTIPLYYDENKKYAAVASNRKMLWSLNLEPKPVEPGTVIILSTSQKKVLKINKISQSYIKKGSLEQKVKIIDKIFSDVAYQISRKIPKGSVSFSGGIDSILTAYYLKKAGVKLELICFGINNRKEYILAREAANSLDIPLSIHPHSHNELEKALPDIVKSVEDPNLMKIGVATPLYFSAKIARKKGYNAIFSGNGNDELFGGYMKYLKMHLEGKDPRPVMTKDVKNSWSKNFERDTKVCKDLGIKLILPSTHPKVIKYGLSLPTEHLLPEKINKPRKIVIRELAKTLGFPSVVYNRPKKAAQYSTGVNKAIIRIAKKYGLRPWDYLREIYNDVKETYITPH